jgi:hypothetical protein
MVDKETLQRSVTLTRVRVVAYEEFSERTGYPPPSPLDLSVGYGGWLLP